MANLMITTACNFRCPYCFGLDLFGPGQQRQTMPMNLFGELLDWIDRAEMPEIDIHLMGGEPTLHPAFGEMVEELSRRQRKTMVFSNAATPMDERIFCRSVELGASWIVNCNPPDTYPGDQLKLLHRHLAILGPTATITFNLINGHTPYQYVFDYIQQYHLAPSIKLGVALPTLEHRNVHAHWKELPTMAKHIMKLLQEAQSRQISLAFECGVPYCLFDEKQHRELKNIQVSHCGSRLDITPLGNVINCLPLARMAAISFQRFDSYRQAREWFHRMQTPYRQVGCASRCLACEHRLAGLCSACLAFGIGEYSRIALPPLPETRPPGQPVDRDAGCVSPGAR